MTVSTSGKPQVLIVGDVDTDTAAFKDFEQTFDCTVRSKFTTCQDQTNIS